MFAEYSFACFVLSAAHFLAKYGHLVDDNGCIALFYIDEETELAQEFIKSCAGVKFVPGCVGATSPSCLLQIPLPVQAAST